MPFGGFLGGLSNLGQIARGAQQYEGEAERIAYQKALLDLSQAQRRQASLAGLGLGAQGATNLFGQSPQPAPPQQPRIMPPGGQTAGNMAGMWGGQAPFMPQQQPMAQPQQPIAQPPGGQAGIAPGLGGQAGMAPALGGQIPGANVAANLGTGMQPGMGGAGMQPGGGAGAGIDPGLQMHLTNPAQLATLVREAAAAKGIKASDEDVFGAVQSLMKLESPADRAQTQYYLTMLRLASQERQTGQRIEGRHEDVATQQAGATGRTAMTQEGAASRSQAAIAARAAEGDKNRSAAMDRQLARLQNHPDPKIRQQTAVFRSQIAEASNEIARLTAAIPPDFDGLQAAYQKKAQLEAEMTKFLQAQLGQSSPTVPSDD